MPGRPGTCGGPVDTRWRIALRAGGSRPGPSSPGFAVTRSRCRMGYGATTVGNRPIPLRKLWPNVISTRADGLEPISDRGDAMQRLRGPFGHRSQLSASSHMLGQQIRTTRRGDSVPHLARWSHWRESVPVNGTTSGSVRFTEAHPVRARRTMTSHVVARCGTFSTFATSVRREIMRDSESSSPLLIWTGAERHTLIALESNTGHQSPMTREEYLGTRLSQRLMKRC